MTRETTLEAYRIARESGLVSELRLKVFKILCEHGAMTANEMRQYGDPNANSGVYSTRLSELERMELVETIGKRKCKTTGRIALVWKVTGLYPKKLERDKTKKERQRELLKKIEQLGKALDKCTRIQAKQDLREIYSLAKKL